MKKNVIVEKSFDFAVAVLGFCKHLQEERQFVLANQLLKSGTSIGANVREATGSLTQREFISKMQIAYRECYETLYWIELLKVVDFVESRTIDNLHRQCEELKRIISSILITSKRNLAMRE